MKRDEILAWLRENDPRRMEDLWRLADEMRLRHVGPAVHLRGLIEVSNHCARSCHYCGLAVTNTRLTRYRLSADEILACAGQAVEFGYGTVVMQAGEDYGITREWMAEVVARIKSQTPLAVTLSLGERPDKDLAAWRQAGADRYLLRFETSNRTLYDRIHPPLSGQGVSDRPAILRRLRELGYEVGSGVMIGIPGQTYDSLVDDIELFAGLDLEMIGVGPFIAHPDTPLGRSPESAGPEQVPNTELMTYKVIALTRLACPDANIPSTTALATINPEQGRELGLRRGANVVMPNITPVGYRPQYEIYPGKACIRESAGDCRRCLETRILSIGRTIGSGRGDSPRMTRRKAQDRRG